MHYRRWVRTGTPDGFLDRKGSRNPNWRGGKRSHPLYFIHSQMVLRCTHSDHPNYANYGGRGITVCDRWRNDFWAFVEDMGSRPEGRTLSGKRPAYNLDRINNDGNYEPENCRWVDLSTSGANRRPQSFGNRWKNRVSA